MSQMARKISGLFGRTFPWQRAIADGVAGPAVIAKEVGASCARSLPNRKIPEAIRAEAVEIRQQPDLLHPYWVGTWNVKVHRPPLLPVVRVACMGVDAVTGKACVIDSTTLQAPDEVQPDARVLPRSVTVDSIEVARLEQSLFSTSSRKLRTWSNVDLDFLKFDLHYRLISIYRVVFNDSTVVIGVCSISGDCAILSDDTFLEYSRLSRAKPNS